MSCIECGRDMAEVCVDCHNVTVHRLGTVERERDDWKDRHDAAQTNWSNEVSELGEKIDSLTLRLDAGRELIRRVCGILARLPDNVMLVGERGQWIEDAVVFMADRDVESQLPDFVCRKCEKPLSRSGPDAPTAYDSGPGHICKVCFYAPARDEEGQRPECGHLWQKAGKVEDGDYCTQCGARRPAGGEASKIAPTVAEEVANRYIQKELPFILREYLELFDKSLSDTDAASMADAQDGGEENENV